MPHPETEYRCRVVVPDFLFLRVEADALADEGRFGAVGAPDREGHFEAHGQDALGGFPGARAEGVFFGDGVGGKDAFVLGRDVASHVCVELVVRKGREDWGGGARGEERGICLLKPCILQVDAG